MRFRAGYHVCAETRFGTSFGGRFGAKHLRVIPLGGLLGPKGLAEEHVRFKEGPKNEPKGTQV